MRDRHEDWIYTHKQRAMYDPHPIRKPPQQQGSMFSTIVIVGIVVFLLSAFMVGYDLVQRFRPKDHIHYSGEK